MADNYFKVKKVTSLEQLMTGKDKDGKEIKIPESDITFQTEKNIIQMELVEDSGKTRKVKIKPGCFNLVNTQAGIGLENLELRTYNLLDKIDNTKQIVYEANKFFDKLDVYKKLKLEPKRGVLLASPPGVGKTSAINKVVQKFLEDDGTCVLNWDTASVRSQSITNFFTHASKFTKEVKRLIMIIEDISGGTMDNYGGARATDSSLLNLLDGVGRPFSGIPTFIIATTNNPEQAVGALIDRPGRFDKVIELKTPSKDECKMLLEFISGNKLTEEDLEAAEIAADKGFSIAHLEEMVKRTLLYDITLLEAAEELKKHKNRFDELFQKESSRIGI